MPIPLKTFWAILGLGISMLVVPDAVQAGVLNEQWDFETSSVTQTGVNGKILTSSWANAVSSDSPWSTNAMRLANGGNYRLYGYTTALPFGTTGASFNVWIKDDDSSSSTPSRFDISLYDHKTSTTTNAIITIGSLNQFICPHSWSCTTEYNTLTTNDYYAQGDKNYWHMLTVNIASSYMELFFDGVSKWKKNYTTFVWDGYDMTFDIADGNSDEVKVDELKFFSGLLSQSQIDYLYTHTATSPGQLSLVFPADGQIVKDFPNYVIDYSVNRYYQKLQLLVEAWTDEVPPVEWNDYEIVPGIATTTQWSLAKQPALLNGQYSMVVKLNSLTNCDSSGLFCDSITIAETATSTFEIDNENGDSYLTTSLDSELDNFYAQYDCKTICNDVSSSTGIFDEMRYGIECGGKKVLCWAFIPSRDSIKKGQTAMDGFKENFPLSLAYDVYDTIGTTSTSTMSLNIGELFPGSTTMIVMSPTIASNWTESDWFQNSIYNPLKWIIYGMTLYYCVRRTFRTGAQFEEQTI